jgi:outer membrane protein OmpA-like peptidoglycan-associated protein
MELRVFLGDRISAQRANNAPEHRKQESMYRNAKWIPAYALLCCLFTSLALAQITPGEKAEIKGLITTRDADTITVKTNDKGSVVVVINDATKVQVPKGIFRHSDMAETNLIPGLAVEVKGVGGDSGQIQAETIRFSKDDLKTAQTIQAGLTPTKQQVETNQKGISANQAAAEKNAAGVSANAEKIGTNQADIEAANKRFSELSDWDTKGVAMMTFPTGKATLSDDGKAALTQLAQTAKPLKGYLIQVRGFASTSGDAARNQELSDERANAVVAFLQQQGGIPLRHIVTPAAMGSTNPLASNDTAAGRDLNQRVEVKLLVNRGVNAPDTPK